MSLVDSIDSIFMLYAYLGPEGYRITRKDRWKLVKTRSAEVKDHTEQPSVAEGREEGATHVTDTGAIEPASSTRSSDDAADEKDGMAPHGTTNRLPSLDQGQGTRDGEVDAKTQTISDLSIGLMAMSIAVALRYVFDTTCASLG
jgi:hypothetical protein